MTAREQAMLRDRIARERLASTAPAPSRSSKQWTGSATCPVHRTSVALRGDGKLGSYCPQCLGEAAMALERWGYTWRLKGFAL